MSSLYGVIAGLLLVALIGLVSDSADAQPAKAAEHVATIETAKGNIVIKLLPEVAPKTVARIEQLITQRFYDGQRFHRVVAGFVIQMGDPQSRDMTKEAMWGTGGTGVKIPAEFSDRKYVNGTVGMARANDPNSNDSQFFISLGRHSNLDKQYTVFGEVTQGMDVAEKIVKGDVVKRMTLK